MFMSRAAAKPVACVASQRKQSVYLSTCTINYCGLIIIFYGAVARSAELQYLKAGSYPDGLIVNLTYLRHRTHFEHAW